MSTLRALLRSGVALLLMELRQHLGTALLLAMLTVPAMFIGLIFAMAQGGASVAAVGAGVVYYWMPIPVLVLMQRLVVHERADGTHSFLAALPPPMWLRLTVKLIVGLALLELMSSAALLTVLAIAWLREIITLAWVAQLVVQAGVYVAAWSAVTLAATHLGRFRSWFWLVLLGSLELFDDDTRWQAWTWLAALAAPTDAGRHAVPWAGLGVSAAYTLGALLIAYALAGWRGGALPAAWFRESSTRDRVAGASLVLLWMLIAEVLPEVGRPELHGWELVPEAVAGDARVRSFDPALQPHAVALLRALDHLDAWAGPGARTTIALTPEAHGPTPPEAPVRVWDADDATLVLRVAGPANADFVARAVDGLLEQRSSGLLAHAADRAWLRDGLGLYLAELGQEPILAKRRAAWAVRDGLDRAALADWREVRRRYGADVAAGIAALGVRAWVDEAGEARTGAVVQAALLTPRSGGPASVLGLYRSKPDLGDEEALRERWWQHVADATDLPYEDDALPEVLLFRSPAELSNLDLGYTAAAALPAGAELIARELDPVRGVFLKDSPVWRSPIAAPTGVVPTWAAEWSAVEATVSVWSEAQQAHLITGWVEVSR